MKVKKIIVGADGTEVEIGGGSGSGTAINASLYFDTENRMLIKCNEGEIQEGDTLQLARYITSSFKVEDADGEEERVRQRGWIRPNAGTRAKYNLDSFAIEFDHNEDGQDFWHVTLDGEEVYAYEVARQEIVDNSDDSNATQLPLSLQRRCGLAVMRDNVRITEYMRFCVVYNTDGGMMTATRW